MPLFLEVVPKVFPVSPLYGPDGRVYDMKYVVIPTRNPIGFIRIPTPIKIPDTLSNWYTLIEDDDREFYLTHGYLPLGAASAKELFAPVPNFKPERQGNIAYNINGNGAYINTSQGANGWTPTVATSLEGNATSSGAPPAPRPAGPLKPVRGGDRSARIRPNTDITSASSQISGGTVHQTSTIQTSSVLVTPASHLSLDELSTSFQTNSLIRVAAFSWEPSDAVGSRLRNLLQPENMRLYTTPFPQILFHDTNNPDVRNMMSGVYYSCAYRLTCTVSGAIDLAGALALCYHPAGWAMDSSTISFVNPSSILNLNSATSVQLNIPWTCPYPALRRDELAGHLVVSVLSPISQAASVTIYAQIIDLRVSCTVAPQVYPAIHVSTNPTPSVVNSLTPVVNPMMDHIPDQSEVSTLGEITDWTQAARFPGLVAYMEWEASATASQRIGLYALSPTTLYTSTLTPLSQVLQMFSQFRGDVIIDLIFCGPHTSRGTAAVCVTPPLTGSAPSLTQALSAGSVTWDITTSNTISVVVPYSSNFDWLPSSSVASTPAEILKTTLGFLSVFNISAPAVTSKILLFVRAADNFEVRFPSPLLTAAAQNGVDVAAPTPEPSREPGSLVSHYFSNLDRLRLGGGSRVSLQYSNSGRFQLDLNAETFHLGGFRSTSAVESSPRSLPSLLTRLATYYRSDCMFSISVAFSQPAPAGTEVNLSFLPPGTPVFDDVARYSGLPTQTIIIGDERVVTFSGTIPYTSYVPVITPRHFADDDSEYSVGSHGSLILRISAPDAEDRTAVVSAKVGFPNLRLWWPRTLIPRSGFTHPNTNAIRDSMPTNGIVVSYADPRTAKAERQVFLVGRSRFNTLAFVNTETQQAITSIPTIFGRRVCVADVKQVTPDRLILPMHMEMAQHLMGRHVPCSPLSEDPLFTILASGSAQAPQVPERQSNVFRSVHDATNAISAFNNNMPAMSASMEKVVKNLDLPTSAKTFAKASADLNEAAKTIADSVQTVTSLPQSLISTLRGFSPAPIWVQFLSSFSMVVGAIISVLSSPTPGVIAGVLIMISASLPNFIYNVTKPISSLFLWIAQSLGLSVSEADVPDGIDNVVGPTQQGRVRDFNDTINAFKNADWLILKVLDLIQKLLEWLNDTRKSDPSTVLAESVEEINSLYDDSVASLSSTSVDIKQAESNRAIARSHLIVADRAKSHAYVQVLNQTIRNYTTTIETRAAQQSKPRSEPYVIYLHGKPGCGKSLLASLLAATLAQKLSGDSSDVYSPSDPRSAYFDGYTGQAVHVIDDIGQDPDGNDWRLIPQLVSSTPFIVPMASLEEKGRFYTSKVIIMTSNFEGPTPDATRCVSALARRLRLRIPVVLEDSYHFNVTEMLTPCGPPTRHFTSNTPFLSMQGVSMGEFKHVDDIVDKVLSEINNNACNSSIFNSLIKRQNNTGYSTPMSEPDPAPLAFAPSSGDDDPLKQGLAKRLAWKALEGLVKYQKPIHACLTFVSLLSVTMSLISTVSRLVRSRAPTVPEGPYTGLPGVSKRARGPTRPVRQSLHPAVYKISRSVVRIFSTGPIGYGSSVGFFIRGRWVVATSHAVGDDAIVEDAVNSYHVDKIIRIGELALLHVPKATEHPDLTRFVLPPQGSSGLLISSFDNGPGFILASDVKYITSDCPDITAAQTYHYKTPSYHGLCGAPLLSITGSGPRLVGVHVAGVLGTTGYADPIGPVVETLNTLSQPQSVVIPAEPIEPVFVPRKSKLVPSPAHGAFPVTKIPAVLSNKDRRIRDSGIDIDEVAFSKQGTGDITTPWSGLEEAADVYFSQFPTFRTLTMSEAINGTPSLEGLDMNQSAGIPWSPRSRRSLFTLEDGVYSPVPELEDAVKRVLADPKYIYNTFLKDELRPTEKALKGKTRLVEAAPIHAIIAGRMLFGGLFEYMYSNPGKHGSAVGCDPDIHWTTFFHSFSDFENVWAIDYSCYDSTLPTACFDVMAKHLARLIKPSPDLPENCVQKYIASISYSEHVFGTRHYFLQGGNPSGCVGTSIFNSIINNMAILSVMLHHHVPIHDPTSYQILSYGDDVIYSSYPNLHPTLLKEYYDKHTTFKVTPADKTDVFPETSTIYDVTFLKRSFVPDETIPYYIHPVIEAATYEQSIMWSRGGDFQDTVTSLSFLAWHAGEDKYNQWVDTVKAKCATVASYPSFPPYSYLYYRWLQAIAS
ncbi:polyprotein [pygoscepivirus A1]|uniref:Genome polyprotein n=1 Tax=pygoscepivirus A1 TaxID=2870380 RepID=A0A6B7H7N3_9PICO|nr:polyprotein [Pingu picornavirus]QCI31548.1 polyprotein [pygoscepivirus A1]